MMEKLAPSDEQIRKMALNFPDAPETVALEETSSLYPDEWVLLRVTAYDFHQNPTHGIILDHSQDRGKISETLANQPPGGELPYLSYRTTPTRFARFLAGTTAR